MQHPKRGRIQLSVLALTLILALVPLTQVSAQIGTVTINEVDADTPSYDTLEFIELYDGGAGSTTLDGAVVVLFDGSDDASYAAFDLDGYSTDANGYFVIGSVPGVICTWLQAAPAGCRTAPTQQRSFPAMEQTSLRTPLSRPMD